MTDITVVSIFDGVGHRYRCSTKNFMHAQLSNMEPMTDTPQRRICPLTRSAVERNATCRLSQKPVRKVIGNTIISDMMCGDTTINPMSINRSATIKWYIIQYHTASSIMLVAPHMPYPKISREIILRKDGIQSLSIRCIILVDSILYGIT